MIAAMIFITPGAIRPAIATKATATKAAATTKATKIVTKIAITATKAVKTVINALASLFDRLKDACRRLFGLNATNCVSRSIAVAMDDAVAATDAPSTAIQTLPNANEDNEIVVNALPIGMNDSNVQDVDDSVTLASIPWLPQNAKVIDNDDHLTGVLLTAEPDAPFFRWIPHQVLRRFATDALTIHYFNMIRYDDKYATLSTDQKHASILLLNMLHLKNQRQPYELDEDDAIVDIVVRIVLSSTCFVKAYFKLMLWEFGYSHHRIMMFLDDRDPMECPIYAEQRAALTTAFRLDPTD